MALHGEAAQLQARPGGTGCCSVFAPYQRSIILLPCARLTSNPPHPTPPRPAEPYLESEYGAEYGREAPIKLLDKLLHSWKEFPEQEVGLGLECTWQCARRSACSREGADP